MKYYVDIELGINKNYYIYIYNNNNDIFASDFRIIDLLGLSEEQYFNIAKQFNGIVNQYLLYFKEKSDIIKFKEWLEENIEYLLILKKIEGK